MPLHTLLRIFQVTASVHATYLQAVLTKFNEALDEVILCLSQQLLDSLTPFG